jgi:PRTRC genetic system protein E
MFKELMPVIKHRPLTITVALLPDGKIRACVIPQSLESDGKVNDKVKHVKEVATIPESAIQALTTPLAVTGTAEELDAGLAQQLATFAQSHVQLQNGIEQATLEITEALKAIQDRDKSKTKAKVKTAPESNNQGKADGIRKEEPNSGQASLLPVHWLATSSPAAVSSNDIAGKPEGTEAEEEVSGHD